MADLFGGIRAPSTLGSHLRSLHLGQRPPAGEGGPGVPGALAGQAPLLPGAGTLAFIDIDSMQKRVYGHHKQGARFGHTKIQGKSLLVRGLNALAAVDQHAAGRAGDRRDPAARRERRLRPRRGQPRRRAIGTAREAGCTGPIIVRLDSAYYNAAVIGAVRRGGARFSVTVPMNRQHPRRDRRHQRGRLDPDPLPARDLGRPARPAGSPTPRSPRCSTRRSRRRRARRSPPG